MSAQTMLTPTELKLLRLLKSYGHLKIEFHEEGLKPLMHNLLGRGFLVEARTENGNLIYDISDIGKVVLRLIGEDD